MYQNGFGRDNEIVILFASVESGDYSGGWFVVLTNSDIAIIFLFSPTCIPLSPSSTAIVAWFPPINTLTGLFVFSFENNKVPFK